MDDIAATLERSLALRRFHLSHLKMEQAQGSILNQIIGVGNKADGDSQSQPVLELDYHHYKTVVAAFTRYDIPAIFGESITTAMELPVNQWYYIHKVAENFPRKDKSLEEQMLEIIKAITAGPQGGE